MKDFAAIDFETANRELSSVCSVGVIVVRNGEILHKIYRLIKPLPNYYSTCNVRVHGLTSKDTETADSFPEVWAEIESYIEDLPLVAHFSRFDENCLKAAFKRYGLRYPNYKFYCTCQTSRRIFGKSLPNHKLPTVAKACGFTLENHHNALWDALACCHIALQIL